MCSLFLWSEICGLKMFIADRRIKYLSPLLLEISEANLTGVVNIAIFYHGFFTEPHRNF